VIFRASEKIFGLMVEPSMDQISGWEASSRKFVTTHLAWIEIWDQIAENDGRNQEFRI